MRCTIIDQDLNSIHKTHLLLDKINGIEVVSTYSSAMDAMKIQNDNIDLLIIEVDLPYLSGLEIIKSLKCKPLVIFTSSTDKYALEAFEVKAIDYLLKPFSLHRFELAIIEAQKRLSFGTENNTTVRVANTIKAIWVKSEYNFIKISLDNILYIEGLKDYLKIHLKNRPRPILTLNSLKKIEARLPSERFYRIHRSYIVSIDNIEEIHRNRIKIGDTTISIGDNYKELFYRNVVEASLV